MNLAVWVSGEPDRSLGLQFHGTVQDLVEHLAQLLIRLIVQLQVRPGDVRLRVVKLLIGSGFENVLPDLLEQVIKEGAAGRQRQSRPVLLLDPGSGCRPVEVLDDAPYLSGFNKLDGTELLKNLDVVGDAIERLIEVAGQLARTGDALS